MGMKMVVTMNVQGRVTLPAAAREMLHVSGETQFELEVTEHELVMRPALVIPREDAWAYTPENLASIARGRRQLREGRAHEVNEDQLGA